MTEIQAAITGIKRAYVNAPMSLPESDLPLFCNFIGPSTTDYDQYGDGDALQMREFTMRLYVMIAQAGVNGEAEKKVEPYIPLVYAAFLARPGLSSATTGHTAPLAGIRGAFIYSDGGISVLPFAGQDFIGCEFKLRVHETFSYTFAQGE